jgi:fatty-acid desaturase
VSCHRYHHLHCETPLDPHSVYEGFWWSHMGWLLDDRATQSRVHDNSNASGACPRYCDGHRQLVEQRWVTCRLVLGGCGRKQTLLPET